VADLTQANNDMNQPAGRDRHRHSLCGSWAAHPALHPHRHRIINLIESDVGRPVGHIVSKLIGYDCLLTDVQAVLDTLSPKKIDVQTAEGRWYTMRILPIAHSTT